MEDFQILNLYWKRDETAILETDRKYGRLCYQIANHLLCCQEDSEECLNDTYMCSWNSIPPKKPVRFQAFLCKITRNIALKKLEYRNAMKRSPDCQISFDEIEEILPDPQIHAKVEDQEISWAINRFLWAESPDSRNVFLRRYWYFDSIRVIAQSFGFSESKVKSMLFHARKRLRAQLEKEGIAV